MREEGTVALVDVSDLKLYLGITSSAEDDALEAWLAEALSIADGHCHRTFELATYTEYPTDYSGPLLYTMEWPVGAISGTDDGDPATELGVWYDPTGEFGSTTKLVAGAAFGAVGADYMLVPMRDGGGELRWLGRGTSVVGSWGYGWCVGDCHREPGWPGGAGALKLVYTAGHTESTFPDELRQAIMAIAAGLRLEAIGQQASTVQQAGGTGGMVKQIQRGQSRITYATPSEMGTTSSSTTTTGARPIAPDPWKVLDRYRKVLVG